MTDDADWRLNFAHHLRGVVLGRKVWVPRSENWDHDHCAACQKKFGPDAEMLKEGYATRDDYKFGARYEWVCADCFDGLKDEVGWTAL